MIHQNLTKHMHYPFATFEKKGGEKHENELQGKVSLQMFLIPSEQQS